MQFNRNYFLSFVLGSIINLSFAPFKFIPIIIPTLGGLILLLNKSQVNKFKLGWYFGFGNFLLGLYWICNSLFVDIRSFWWLVPFALTLIPAVLAIYIGIVCWLFDKYKTDSVWDILLFSSLWVIAEYGRSKIIFGFPWNLIGYSLASSEVLSQAASIIGIYGLSFIVVAFSLSIYYIALYPKRILPYCLFIFLPFIIFLYGIYRLQSPTQFTDEIIRLVQPNIQQKSKWLPEERRNNLLKQLNLTKENQPQNLKLIIWPESAVNYNVEDPNFRSFVVKVIPEDSYLLLGGVHIQDNKFYNSIFTLNKEGQIIDYYDKIQLVPFGEYIPLNRFNISIINKHFGSGFTPGSKYKTISLSSLSSNFSPLICYEAIFNDLITSPTRGKWILNITNDAWFGESSGPYQHLAMAKIRAIEQGLPLVRVANTGISVIFDPFGREVIKTKLNQEAIIDHNLPQPISATIFSKIGNLPIIFISIIYLLMKVLQKTTKILTN